MNTIVPLRLPTEAEASMNQRTHAVQDVSQVLRYGDVARSLPEKILQVIKLRAWEEFQTPLGATIRNASMQEWIVSKPPQGLGSTPEKIKKLLQASDNADEALLAFDREVRGEHGGAHNPTGTNQHTKEAVAQNEVKTDNISHDQKIGRNRNSRYGTSKEEGLRRLDDAAASGNIVAADLLRRVLDKNDPLTVNGACVRLGWRKPVRTVVDTDDGVSDAVVRRLGPLDAVRQIWKRATPDQRREIAIWISEQELG